MEARRGEALVRRQPAAVGAGFDYESIPDGYYDLVYRRRAGVQSKWHHLKFARVVEEMRGHPRHLDLGCGPGTLIGLAGAEHDCVGVDISPSQIAYANRAYCDARRRFFVLSAWDLPDEHREFDVATVVEVIEHLSPADVRDVLGSAIDRLRPGGRLIVTTPNFQSAWPLIEALINRFGSVKYGSQHINKFTPLILRRQLEQLGLQDVRVEPYLGFGPFAAALSWRLANLVARVERRTVEPLIGSLLLGVGTKPFVA